MACLSNVKRKLWIRAPETYVFAVVVPCGNIFCRLHGPHVGIPGVYPQACIESFIVSPHLYPIRLVVLPEDCILNPSLPHAASQSVGDVDAQVKRLARGVLDGLDDAKAEDVLAIELEGKTSMADMMVIATGRSSTHVNAIADRVIKSCKAIGVPVRVEGMPQCDWVLVDGGDVIVHVFRPEVRQFYNLEKMWGVDRPSERRTS